jgi:Kdo2-lipid IVA lauroyltransferase/acyltransferase
MTARIKNKLGKLFLLLMARIPFPALGLLAQIVAAITWYGHTRIRKVITVNITLCYPHLSVDEKQRLAKQATLETIRTGMEMPRIWIKAKHDDPALAAGIEGQELIEQALSKGKGLILITPHLGNWEYLIIKMASLYRCSVLCNNADDIVPMAINDTVQSGRMKTGATMVEAQLGVKVLVETLKRGEIVLIAPDQIPASTNAYIFADFFGQLTPTMTLVSRLAKVTDAQILSAFARRLESGQYQLVIKPVDPGIYSRDLEESVLALNKTVENLINEAPAQFLWTYKRFRRGPEGRNKIYKRR